MTCCDNVKTFPCGQETWRNVHQVRSVALRFRAPATNRFHTLWPAKNTPNGQQNAFLRFQLQIHMLGNHCNHCTSHRCYFSSFSRGIIPIWFSPSQLQFLRRACPTWFGVSLWPKPWATITLGTSLLGSCLMLGWSYPQMVGEMILNLVRDYKVTRYCTCLREVCCMSWASKMQWINMNIHTYMDIH